jgi:hypothetical protein
LLIYIGKIIILTCFFHRDLKDVEVIFIIGGELLTAHAAYKFSEAVNIARKEKTPQDCGMCGMKPLFGGALVIILCGDTTPCRERSFFDTKDGSRSAAYRYTGRLPEWTEPPPPYVAPATQDEDFDQVKAIEMNSELKFIYLFRFHNSYYNSSHFYL